MQRIWLHFTERQAKAIKEDAKRRGISVSEVVREVMALHYTLEMEHVERGKKYVSPGAVS